MSLRQTERGIRKAWLGLAALALLAGCGTVGFDPAHYQTVVQLKYETLTLVDQSSGRYAPNKPAADALLAKYAVAAETAGRGAGGDSIAQQWAAIRDPRGTSAANLIEIWKKAPLRPGQRAEKKRAIAAHFDRLICLEAAKQAASECGDVGAVAEAGVEPAPAPAPVARPAARRAAPKPAAADEPEMETEPQKE